MSLHFLTKDREEIVFKQRYEYTKQDVLDLGALASSIEALTHVMIAYCLNADQEQGWEIGIFSIYEALMEPISQFLNEGAPMRERDP